jgi:hypothetical protein
MNTEYINENSSSSDEENKVCYKISNIGRTWSLFKTIFIAKRFFLQKNKSWVSYKLRWNERFNNRIKKKHKIKWRIYECTYSQDHASKKVVNIENQRNRKIYQINCP